MSMKACVTLQATEPLWAKCGNPGTPGTVIPTTSKRSQARWTWAYIFGISSTRCGSPASSGRPVSVWSGASAQLLLPPPLTSGAAVSSSAATPGCRSAISAWYGPVDSPGGRHSSSSPPSSKRSRVSASAPTMGSAAARHSFHQTEPIRKPIWRITAIECQGSQAPGSALSKPYSTGREPVAMKALTPRA